MNKEYIEDVNKAKDEASIELTTDEDVLVQSSTLKKNLDKDMKQFTAEEHEEGFVFLIYMYNSTIFEELEKKAPGSKGDIHIIRFNKWFYRFTYIFYKIYYISICRTMITMT